MAENQIKKKKQGGWNKGLTKERMEQLQEERLQEAEKRIRESVSSELEKSVNELLPTMVKSITDNVVSQVSQSGQAREMDPAELEKRIQAHVSSAVSASLSEVNKQIDGRIDGIANKLEAIVKESVGKMVQPAGATEGQPVTGDGRPGLNTMLQIFGQSLGQGFAQSMGRTMTGAGGSASIAPLVKELGETIRGLFGILEPLNDLKIKTRQETLNDLITLAKVGQQGAVDRIFREAEIPKTDLQSPTYEIDTMAKNVRLNPKGT